MITFRCYIFVNASYPNYLWSQVAIQFRNCPIFYTDPKTWWELKASCAVIHGSTTFSSQICRIEYEHPFPQSYNLSPSTLWAQNTISLFGWLLGGWGGGVVVVGFGFLFLFCFVFVGFGCFFFFLTSLSTILLSKWQNLCHMLFWHFQKIPHVISNLEDLNLHPNMISVKLKWMLSFVPWGKSKFKKVKKDPQLPLHTHPFSHLLKCWEIIYLSKRRFEHTWQGLQAPEVLQF